MEYQYRINEGSNIVLTLRIGNVSYCGSVPLRDNWYGVQIESILFRSNSGTGGSVWVRVQVAFYVNNSGPLDVSASEVALMPMQSFVA